MRKLVLLLLLVCLLGSVDYASAQTTLQAREVEWKNYAVPQTNFARQIDPEKNFVFRVPANWEQEGTDLTFKGPHSSMLRVFVSKVADGYPLQDFFASILQVIKDTPGAESTLTRKTQLQDLEARELFFETTNPDGEVIRSTAWVTVKGPLAVTFSLHVPASHAAEIEPFFKAVVQSVIFVSPDYPAFETLRSSIIKNATAGPIHEIESMVASLVDVNPDREAAIARLTSLFASHTDTAIDLLQDRRPFVRAAAVQAVARTNNTTLTPFLWEMVDDDEPFVAEAAARVVAGAPDVVAKTLKHSRSGFETVTIARVWSFMSREKRIELLQKIFNETAVPKTSPPPGIKPGVKVTVTTLEPIQPGKPVPDIVVVSNDPNVQIGALALLSTVAIDDFKLPLARIMAANYDPLIAVALQVSHIRGESLPLDPLIKLVASSDEQVSKLAAQSLGLSANVSDLPRVEALISKDSASTKKALDDELRLSVKKISFRQALREAKSLTESREIISKALSDPLLADFAWRYDCEPTVAGCSPSSTQTPFKNDFAVKPFAENLFPKNTWHYTAITNPGQAVQKFYESLHGLQLDSPRAQSNLILMMGFVRQSLAQGLSAPVDAPTLIEYTGIDPNSPIAMAAWTSEQALETTGFAQRKAIVLRVKDRARFERAVEKFQRESGSFVDLTSYVSLGTRIVAALPAFLPLTAQAVLNRDPKEAKTTPILSYGFIGDKEWNGLRVKTVEHNWISSSWVVESASTHMVFLGDTVLLTPDLATMRDLLGKVNDPGNRHLADNPEFRKAIANQGDVVYFSNVKSFLARFAEGDKAKPDEYNIKESGALNIGNATWENSHQLVFAESGWAKPLLPFHPKELSAPRDLLPATTIAYYLMKVDLTSGSLFGEDIETVSKRWGLDLKKDVLAELGPECGAVLLELPNFDNLKEDPTWASFCKLKSNKLVEALNAGKLFSGVGPAKDFVELKAGEVSYFVTTRSGFMVIANREKALAAFDGKSNLASTRDYSRAVEKVPSGIVAFGGYNLEAAIAAAGKPSGDASEAMVANIIFSVASAFHSQNFYATVTAGTVEGRSSVAMDREGRYKVSDLAFLPRAANISFVTIEPSGVPIRNQKRLSSLVVKVRAKSAGPIDLIKDDIKTADQTVEQKSAKELLLTIAARQGGVEKAVELPVKDPQFAEFLKATTEFPVDDPQVKEQARQIAGEDRDAWSVARKLADWTYKNLEWRLVQSASAAQTLATREADCSEFSALFVAMARSLGLPSRTVGGLAYSGNSFGGHAWVEVWAGKWIELDPTWGTHFVDATHIRDASNELVMSAALNLIEIEVMETRRAVADFQKSPSALMQHLLKAIPGNVQSDLEAAIDMETLTDEFMGAGAWSKLNDGEREQMWSAYRRLLKELVFAGPEAGTDNMRLLHLEIKDNVAEATCLLDYADLLLKLRLVRRNDLWHLVEVLQTDVHFHSASETLKPTITNIEKARAGEKPSPSRVSDFSRVLILLQSDAAKAVAAADALLKDKPKDQGFRFLKGAGLLEVEKEAEGIALLKELINEGFAPAVYKLADHLSASEDENQRAEAITLYERYSLLEPYDPRVLHELASAYEEIEACDKAEEAFRKAIERDPGDTYGYVRLVEHLAVHDKIGDVGPVLVAGEKYKAEDEDLFGQAMYSLFVSEETAAAEKLARSDPQRMKTSYEGNLSLARLYVNDGRHAAAMQYLNTSIRLDPEAAAPHVWVAHVHRKMSRWTAAVKAAQRAIDLDAEYSEGYYQLACALTRLGRTKEALAALTKSVELDPDQVEYMVEEADLKALSKMPGFKKLIPEPAKQ